MTQQRHASSTLELTDDHETKENQIPTAKTSLHSLTKRFKADNKTLNTAATSCSYNAHSEPSEHLNLMHGVTAHTSGSCSNCGKRKRKKRNSMALPNTPFFPQNLASQETQTQASRHLEKLNRDGEMTQIPVALHLTNGSFIYGGAKHQAAIEQWSIGDEPFNTVRGDLARLGTELQENARQQIRIIRETEGPDATDIISDTDGAAVEGRIIFTTKAPR
ncbi:hypothetical protein FOWG_17035 [Fusarium oxysporum f. sp. lycopersici MN25]|nr:hypothetical protein FOWG_17035 [Fusarium oxysporum f. sp. lycopersici MN25]